MVRHIDNILGAISDAFVGLFPENRKTSYDSDFGSTDLLSRFNYGFRYGTKSLPLSLSVRNSIIYGNSGSSKSASVLSPTIARLMGRTSFLVNDPSSSEFTKWAPAITQAKARVKRIFLNKPQYGGYNPLQRVKTISDIKKVAKILVQNALGNPKDPFWNISAEMLISILIEYVIYYAEPQFRTMHNVLMLLNVLAYDGSKIDRLFAKTQGRILQEYKTLISYENKVLQNVIASARASISIFSDPDVALATSYDSLELETWRDIPTSVFINNSVADMKYYSVLTSLLATQVLSEIMSNIPEKEKLKIFLLLDECSSLAIGDILQIAMANVRKHETGLMCIYQSPSQIIQQHGTAGAKSLEENAFLKCYLPGVDMQTAQLLETMMGKFEFEDERGKHIRSLMTASEIRELQSDSLLVMSGRRIVKMHLKPFFEQYRLKQLSQLPAIEMPNLLPFTTPPTLQID